MSISIANNRTSHNITTEFAKQTQQQNNLEQPSSAAEPTTMAISADANGEPRCNA
jgi:hypothetical protein